VPATDFDWFRSPNWGYERDQTRCIVEYAWRDINGNWGALYSLQSIIVNGTTNAVGRKSGVVLVLGHLCVLSGG
jgi:hypothetical protein